MVKKLNIFLLILIGLFSNKAFSQTTIILPAEIEADEMFYDENSSKVTAKGSVNVNYEDSNLVAGEVIYDQETRLLKADTISNFSDKLGNKFNAAFAEISDKFDKGVIQNIKGTLSDKSSIKAEKAEIVDKNKYKFFEVEYSPCLPCKGKMLWKFTADEVEYDKSKDKIVYSNAKFKFLNVPIFYTPYFSHSAAAKEGKSGFLMPSIGSSTKIGRYVTIPYYFLIKPNMDFTLSPMITTEEGPVLIGEFRHLIKKGTYNFKASITNPEERDSNGILVPNGDNKIRGHIEGQGFFKFSNQWIGGFETKRSTDDTYLQRYNFGAEDVLRTEVYTTKIWNRNYLNVTALSFQGLKAVDDPGEAPLILPQVKFYKEFKPEGGRDEGRYFIENTSLVLDRDEGAKSRKASTTFGWKKDYRQLSGHLFGITTSIRGDFYQIEDQPVAGTDYEGVQSRAIPEAKLDWSFPLINAFRNGSVILEPLANLIVSPNGNNTDKIPNEDSQDIEISDENLFSANRYSGVDRVEGGSRANYGLRGSLSYVDLGTLSFVAGQSYKTHVDRYIPLGSGLDDNFSDYVSRVSYQNNKHFTAFYRNRIDKDDLTFRKNEVGTTITIDPITLTTSYTFLAEETQFVDRQELYNAAKWQITPFWSVTAEARKNMDNDSNKGWINTGGGLFYEDECLRVGITMNREFTRDRDIEPTTEYLLKLTLKNIGSGS
jgi:LPS-assembly protein